MDLEKIRENIFSKKIKMGDPIISFRKKITKKEWKEMSETDKKKIPVSVGGISIKYHNCNTGNQSYILENIIRDDNYSIYEKNRSKLLLGTYLEYDKIDNCIYLIAGTLSTNNLKDGEKREWEPYCTARIDKDKNIFSTNLVWGPHGRTLKKEDIKLVSKLSEALFLYWPTLIKSGIIINAPHGKSDKEFFKEIMSNLFPTVVTLQSNNMQILDNIVVLEDFLKYVEVRKKDGPKQKEIDALVKMPLPEPHVTEEKPFYNNRVANMCKVKDNLCCLRTFICDGEDFIEGGRVYIGDKIISCKKNNFGDYVNTPLSADMNHWRYALCYFEEGCSKGTKLEYVEDIVKMIDDDKREDKTKAIITSIYYPIIEKLYRYDNSNMKYVLLELVTAANPRSSLRDMVGPFDISKKKLFSCFGLNKHQFKTVVKDGRFTEIRYLRYIFARPSYSVYNYIGSKEFVDISHIDNNTFDKIYSIAKTKFDNFCFNDWYCMNLMYNTYGLEVLSNAIGEVCKLSMFDKAYEAETKISIFDEVCEAETRSSDYRDYRIRPSYLYSDYLDTVAHLQDPRNFRPYFKTYDELVKMHDAAVCIYNLKKDAIKEDLFKKVAGRWNKLEFAPEDEDFAIVAPKKAEEIANEGIILHHCVKTYIDKVINKVTNILFLRTKDAIERPYFTIELDNDRRIQQVHGLLNCCLIKDSPEYNFIKKWAKEKKLVFNNINKVR